MKNKLQLTCVIAVILGLLLTTATGPVLADTGSNLEITNKSGTIFDFTYEEVLAMPKTTVNADLYCDGSLATYGNWTGVLLSYLLTQAQLTPEVGSVDFIASDGYKVSIPIDLAMEPQIIIAYEQNGKPLSEGLRLIVPGANGATWIAKITSITMNTSGAAYPEAIGVGGGKINDLASAQSNKTQQSTTQSHVATQPKSTTLDNSSSIETPLPGNVIDPSQLAPTPQLSNDKEASSYTVVLTVIASVSIIVLSAAGYLTYRRKQNPRKQ